jgi:hypothetical protein
MLNKSMPETSGATIGIPPARAAKGCLSFVKYRLAMRERNLQLLKEVYQVGSGFSNGKWLCCSRFALIAHLSPENLLTRHLKAYNNSSRQRVIEG